GVQGVCSADVLSFFFSSRRRHTRWPRNWSSDVCSSDLSRHRYYWKVRVWDERGQLSESTETSWWEMGFLTPDDWKAQWISWKNPEADADRAGIRWIWIAGQDALKVEPNTSAVFRELVNIPEK